ncbi:MAG: hypothetical protein GYA24_20295 [Candidatus Lokiarchaeota archaeon]|nr:hypothetical protein [Candidatus Lokiarchaeota archaeon]
MEPGKDKRQPGGCSHLERRHDGVYDCDDATIQGSLDCCEGCPAMLPP